MQLIKEQIKLINHSFSMVFLMENLLDYNNPKDEVHLFNWEILV